MRGRQVSATMKLVFDFRFWTTPKSHPPHHPGRNPPWPTRYGSYSVLQLVGESFFTEPEGSTRPRPLGFSFAAKISGRIVAINSQKSVVIIKRKERRRTRRSEKTTWEANTGNDWVVRMRTRTPGESAVTQIAIRKKRFPSETLWRYVSQFRTF